MVKDLLTKQNPHPCGTNILVEVTENKLMNKYTMPESEKCFDEK